MKEIRIPESDKYLANTLFVAGFALCSLVGGVVLEFLKTGDWELCSSSKIVILLLLLTVGLISITIGWLLIGKWELI